MSNDPHGFQQFMKQREDASRVFVNGDMLPMDLRVTEAIRREDGEWKLVHRHANPLVSAVDEAMK